MPLVSSNGVTVLGCIASLHGPSIVSRMLGKEIICHHGLLAVYGAFPVGVAVNDSECEVANDSDTKK